MEMKQAHGDLELVEIPTIEVPFPLEASQHAEQAQINHTGWADRHDIFVHPLERRRFSAMNLGALAGLLYPGARGSEDLQLLADWCAWLLLRDDRWDSTEDPRDWERLARRDRSYLRLMREAPGGPDNLRGEQDELYAAFVDLCARLRERAGRRGLPGRIDRQLVAVTKDFFLASVWQATHQRRRDIPTLAEYIRMRSVTGGLDILTFVQAALDGVRLSRKFLATPMVRRMTVASHNVCCWHNDLVSLNKELASGEVQNLVLVLRQDPQSGCSSLPEAVDAAARMIHEEIDIFLEMEGEVGIMEDAGDAAEWYARMLRNRIGGVIAWQEECSARYREFMADSR